MTQQDRHECCLSYPAGDPIARRKIAFLLQNNVYIGTFN